jgi:uncharacterized OB-fold protein
MAGDYAKPLPAPSPLSAPYWAGLTRRELHIQRCASCGDFVFYPRPHCPSCLSADLGWVEVSGHGKVYSYTIVRRAMNPAFGADVPYVYAIVELEEGPRLMTNVVNCAIEAVQVGMAVKAVYDAVTPEFTLLKFEPA